MEGRRNIPPGAGPSSFPYCGQTRNDGPANRGFVSDYRWQIVDALPFKESIGFYMELFSHERTPGFSYARIGYHYGRPGLRDDHVVITKEEVRRLELPAGWQPQARFGAARGGGYIIQSDHSIPDDVDPKAYDYVVPLVREFGKYPLDLGEFNRS